MTLEVGPARLSDLDVVLADLSEVNKAELATIKVDTETYREYLARNFFGAETVTDEGKPVAVFGYDIRENKIFTWFAATPAYFRNKKSVSFGREYMRRVVARFPRHEIFSLTASPRQDAGRWFHLMGAVEVEKDGPFVLYKFGV
jgi:hypothetical protein